MEEEKKKSSGFGIAAFVLAIIGLLICWVPILNLVTYLNFALALIFGILAIVKEYGRGFGIAALIIGLISVLVAHSINSTIIGLFKNGVERYLETYSGELSDGMTTEEAEELVKEVLSDGRKLLEEHGIYLENSGEEVLEIETNFETEAVE